MTRIPARDIDPDTSHEAALDKIRDPAQLALSQAEVYTHLLTLGAHGATAGEMSDRLNKPRDWFSSRFAELERDGLAYVDGRRVYSGTGKSQQVWKAKAAPTP